MIEDLGDGIASSSRHPIDDIARWTRSRAVAWCTARRRWVGVTKFVAMGLVTAVFASMAFGENVFANVRHSAQAAGHHKPMSAPFPNKLDPPPTPPKIEFGSGLQGNPAALEGNLEGDAEFWELFFSAAAGIAGVRPTPTVPVDGWLTGVTVKGYAVSGDRPGPGGSEPFRVGVEQALPDGRLQVLSTSNPPFQLPGGNGIYYFWVGPPYTGFAMPLKAGEVVSFDTRGGTWAIFAATPGSTTDDAVGSGLEQNAGVKWIGAQRANTELLMQVTEQPSVPTAKLEEASASIAKALTFEQKALSAPTRNRAKFGLRKSLRELHVAQEDIRVAAGANEGEIGHATEVSIEHYLGLASDEDGAAGSAKATLSERESHIKAAVSAKHAALIDISRAKKLAKQVP
jgi:hypothetical protein